MNEHRWHKLQRVYNRIFFSAFLLGAAYLAAHIYFLQNDPQVTAYYSKAVHSRWEGTENPEGRRGDILYRDGSVLATTRRLTRVVLDMKLIREGGDEAIDGIVRMLSEYNGGNDLEIRRRMLASDSRGLEILRGLPAASAREIDDRSFRGVTTLYYLERYYPCSDNGAPATVGFYSSSREHQLGLEAAWHNELRGIPGRREFMRDGSQNRLPGSMQTVAEEVPGRSLRTTLDPAIQLICEEELAAGMEQHNPDWGVAIVMEPHTGQVLAMSSAPDFDPNNFVAGKLFDEQGNLIDQQNPAVHFLVEPGSTAKPLLAAYAVDRGWISDSQRFICNQKINIGRYWITEAEATHYIGDSSGVPVADIIRESSNVGMARIAMKLGQEQVLEAYRSYGLFSRTGVELPMESSGRRPNSWQDEEIKWPTVSLANSGFGQGFSMTPLQLAAAYCVIANGGYEVHPTLKLELEDTAVDGETGMLLVDNGNERVFDLDSGQRRVLSEQGCRRAQEWLRNVVVEGTGKKAIPERYMKSLASKRDLKSGNPRFLPAGKTGTGQIAGKDGKGYEEHAYLASFAGYFPVKDPQYVIVVMYSHPRRGVYYGGSVAAPVFSRITDRISYLAFGERAEVPNET
ncbi:MAG: penicillin-binding protein 2 [Planctomycetales bacterium]|nr:penicillin-binding protein 2 [bacterium]UNM08072.1 MAG: penicillin-binding protein 2 [Planctomycetales bacterium]